MKRNFDLMRDILLKIENQEDEYASIMMEDEKIEYHVDLLIKEGLIEGNIDFNKEFSGNLTSEGHRFLSKLSK